MARDWIQEAQDKRTIAAEATRLPHQVGDRMAFDDAKRRQAGRDDAREREERAKRLDGFR